MIKISKPSQSKGKLMILFGIVFFIFVGAISSIVKIYNIYEIIIFGLIGSLIGAIFGYILFNTINTRKEWSKIMNIKEKDINIRNVLILLASILFFSIFANIVFRGYISSIIGLIIGLEIGILIIKYLKMQKTKKQKL